MLCYVWQVQTLQGTLCVWMRHGEGGMTKRRYLITWDEKGFVFATWNEHIIRWNLVFLRANVDDPTAELQRNLKRFSFMFLLLFSMENRFTQMLSESLCVKTLFSLQRFFLICSICLLPLSCYLVKSFVVWQKSKTEIMKQFKISTFGVTLIWLWQKEHVVRGGQILLELFIDSYSHCAS